MSGATPNFSSGYGFVQADAALALLAFGPPTLTLAASSVAVGSSTTISWTSVDATSCTASGSWTGPLATSGSQTISPTAVGTSTFTLTCLDATGTSKESTVTLTATAAPASSGGGGELGSLMLFGLAALTLVRFTRARVAVNGARRRR
jgi:hypothetical protein